MSRNISSEIQQLRCSLNLLSLTKGFVSLAANKNAPLMSILDLSTAITKLLERYIAEKRGDEERAFFSCFQKHDALKIQAATKLRVFHKGNIKIRSQPMRAGERKPIESKRSDSSLLAAKEERASNDVAAPAVSPCLIKKDEQKGLDANKTNAEPDINLLATQRYILRSCCLFGDSRLAQLRALCVDYNHEAEYRSKNNISRTTKY